jgi:hypothetical protein
MREVFKNQTDVWPDEHAGVTTTANTGPRLMAVPTRNDHREPLGPNESLRSLAT